MTTLDPSARPLHRSLLVRLAVPLACGLGALGGLLALIGLVEQVARVVWGLPPLWGLALAAGAFAGGVLGGALLLRALGRRSRRLELDEWDDADDVGDEAREPGDSNLDDSYDLDAGAPASPAASSPGLGLGGVVPAMSSERGAAQGASAGPAASGWGSAPGSTSEVATGPDAPPSLPVAPAALGEVEPPAAATWEALEADPSSELPSGSVGPVPAAVGEPVRAPAAPPAGAAREPAPNRAAPAADWSTAAFDDSGWDDPEGPIY